MTGIELEQLGLLPAGIDRPTPAAPTGNRPSGTRLPLLSIRGRVVDSVTGAPFNAGTVTVNGDSGHAFTLKEDGRFEIPRIVRGRYVVEVTVFGIGGASKIIDLQEQDESVEISIVSGPDK